ncbi:nodulation protein NfeD [Paenalkalicoccus suaedae]|uniref:Nodulation protein NfeD n=1 Tax=Paenalkalicoccus suaedae TaxID=2592382 RepID=A0A859FF97_9BACI|nr:NfeD family protein [Paenalkalicoccus suaedae]QKS70895.1 nodulation protein NfeD [Paenalkalicoccus suaedae]
MEFLDLNVMGFIVIFLATLFIFGELMVKSKGIFAILGIGIMTMYFSYHLSATDSLWIVVLYTIGLALIIFDGKVTTDGTIAGIGILLMVLGLSLPSPDFTYGIMVALAFLIGAPTSYLFTKVFPKRTMWDKMIFTSRLTSEAGYNSMNDDYKGLIGKQGVTKTPFRPTGTIEIDGKLYSATTDNRWLQEETPIEVVQTDGTRILVKPVEQQAATTEA